MSLIACMSYSRRTLLQLPGNKRDVCANCDGAIVVSAEGREFQKQTGYPFWCLGCIAEKGKEEGVSLATVPGSIERVVEDIVRGGRHQ